MVLQLIVPGFPKPAGGFGLAGLTGLARFDRFKLFRETYNVQSRGLRKSVSIFINFCW